MLTREKPYKITFENRPEYLFAHVEADEIDAEIALAYLREIIDRSLSARRSRILVDRDIPVLLSDSDLFFTTSEFVKMNGEKHKVAFVNRLLENTEYMEFAMVIGKNRGAKFDVFTNLEDAEEWLLAG